MRVMVFILLALALARAAFAQTTVPTDDQGNLVVALPAGWVKSSDLSTLAGFRHMPESKLVATFHPEGARPTDLPYALVEELPPPTDLMKNGLFATGRRVADYYAAALDPPSKADRAGTWKSARVSTPGYSITDRFFSFRATINYEGGINGNVTYGVSVIGHFDEAKTTILTIWTDPAGRLVQGPAIEALSLNGLRENLPGVGGTRPVSFQERLTSVAKISGVILILFVVGVQLFVLWRDRRQRRAEELAWHEPLA